MEKYKIGAVARLLDLPIETLRYYEGRGIVTPQKDEENGYRYYDAWDLNYLLDSICYRSYDFSLNDITRMINEDDQPSLVDRFFKREAELLHTIYIYRQKLDALVKLRQRISQAPKKLGTFEICENPAMIYQRHRIKNEFIFDDDALKLTKKWLDLMPFVNHTFLIPNYSATDLDAFSEYWWGFSQSPDEAIRNGIDISPPVEYIPTVKCIYTVFTAGGPNTFTNSLKHHVISEVFKKGYKIVGPPVGHLIVRIHEDGAFTRYFEIWVPIE
ncbi:DNA-binding transcriptional regulator, MerR family [Sporobacter termitidis DSM 10068]|uniref:DNA-binding transcriptional regulator, MerR family n=1 Tax=Sporobacter termitidis DSM 10068 TaxID=1123282 RepID=A0A1M5XW71_9FIRM|nr:MerR family transcriptional regulator [Sporobacter termitidis]SHI03996.1 DNA-binding transcriptional regulator, MerR family [Sporobacter termitidis DSM 10068]